MTMIANGQEFSRAHNYIRGFDARNGAVGAYLVRDTVTTVPVPAALFMFAPALLGLLGFRRKLNQSRG